MNMALSEPIKKGGRYTKKEKEERQLQVYNLHFEEGKPAIKIAEMLNVNRNTVNEDIKFWFEQFEDTPEALDVNSKMGKQIQRMEIQRSRFFDYLEETETLDEKIKLERLISDIDNRLAQFFSKAMFGKKENLPPSIQFEDNVKEEEVKSFVTWVIKGSTKSGPKNIFSEDGIKYLIIVVAKSEKLYADAVFRKMIEYGLSFCKARYDNTSNFDPSNQEKYDIEKFAEMRGYFTLEEIEEIKIQNEKKQEKDSK
jgi:predicted DNA-binding protein YlxM (UPF0122 family)